MYASQLSPPAMRGTDHFDDTTENNDVVNNKLTAGRVNASGGDAS